MASPVQQRGPPPRLGNKVLVFPIPTLSHSAALHPGSAAGPIPLPQSPASPGPVHGGWGPGLELSLHPLAALHRVRGLRGAALAARRGHLLARLLVTGLVASHPGRR